jgi:chaperonin cofactor prefoldin
LTDNLLTPEVKDPTEYLTELVGEGKKFKDLESLARGKHESDVYIKTLERQMDQLKEDYTEVRNELQARARFEELADRVKAKQTEPHVKQPESRKPEITEDQIETIVSKKLQETETLRKQKENLEMVRARLAEYGDGLENKLKEVGLTGESAAQIAKSNPDLVLKALGVDKPKDQGFTPPPKNTTGFTPQPEQKRTWSYYQDLYKANPSLKYDRNTNVQMQKDYVALGNAFEDGDFHRFG